MKPSDCPCGARFTSYKARRAHREVCTWRPRMSAGAQLVFAAANMMKTPPGPPPVPEEVALILDAPVSPMHEEARRHALRHAEESGALKRIGPGLYVRSKS